MQHASDKRCVLVQLTTVRHIGCMGIHLVGRFIAPRWIVACAPLSVVQSLADHPKRMEIVSIKRSKNFCVPKCDVGVPWKST